MPTYKGVKYPYTKQGLKAHKEATKKNTKNMGKK